MLLKTKPYKHQQDALDRVYNLPFFALFMDPGCGKTKVTIDVVANLYNEGKIKWALIVAPNGVHRQWAIEQFPTHCPIEYTHLVYKSIGWKTLKRQKELVTWKTSPNFKVFFVNVEAFQSDTFLDMLRPIFKELGGECFMCVDESTRIKTHKSKRTKNIQKVGQACSRKAILTGTPITNSPFDIFSQIEFLKLGFWGCNYHVFTHRYGLQVNKSMNNRRFSALISPDEMASIRRYHDKGKSVEEIAYIMKVSESAARYVVEHKNIKHPYRNLDQLKKLVEPFSVIIKKDDCLDLPDKIYEILPVEMSGDQLRVYKEVRKDYLAQFEGKELSLDNKLTLSLRLQQITGGFFPYQYDGDDKVYKADPVMIGNTTGKIEALLNDIEETAGESVIIWSIFTAEIKALYDRFQTRYPEYNAHTYFGETPADERDHIREEFQAGKIRCLIMHPKSGGVGLNLQAAGIHYFYSNGFSLEDRLQAEDRSHRIGQTKHVVYKDLTCIGSIDEKITKALRSHKEVLEYFQGSGNSELFS